MEQEKWTAEGRIEINEAEMRAATEGVKTIEKLREHTSPMNRICQCAITEMKTVHNDMPFSVRMEE